MDSFSVLVLQTLSGGKCGFHQNDLLARRQVQVQHVNTFAGEVAQPAVGFLRTREGLVFGREPFVGRLKVRVNEAELRQAQQDILIAFFVKCIRFARPIQKMICMAHGGRFGFGLIFEQAILGEEAGQVVEGIQI